MTMSDSPRLKLGRGQNLEDSIIYELTFRIRERKAYRYKSRLVFLEDRWRLPSYPRQLGGFPRPPNE